jgi:cyclopropane fatty-acyl-phospholipid synthase-like methyltransferase
MNNNIAYRRANRYPDLDTIYEQCSGPGGLKLAEFMADKMGLQAGKRLLDIGFNRGYQSCFLAKEYGVFLVGIDPWNDRTDQRPHVEHLMDNARSWGVEDRVLGIQIGVPDTKFAAESFEYVYSTTTLEMIRGFSGEDEYRACLAEIHRLLRPGGFFGLGEPMHLDTDIPPDLVPLVTRGEEPWTKFFVSLEQTIQAV